MDIGQKELVCDVLFTTQPNLLSSVLAQKYLGASIENIDVLLNILIVLHLAIEKSGQTLTMISEEEQERELKYLAATVKFSEGLDDKLFADSTNQYLANKNEEFMFAYVLDTILNSGLLDDPSENVKYLLLAGLNLVACIATAKRI